MRYVCALILMVLAGGTQYWLYSLDHSQLALWLCGFVVGCGVMLVFVMWDQDHES